MGRVLVDEGGEVKLLVVFGEDFAKEVPVGEIALEGEDGL